MCVQRKTKIENVILTNYYIDTIIKVFLYKEVQPVSTRQLSLVEKIPHCNNKTLTPTKLAAKKNRVGHSFPNCIVNLSQIVWFGRQVAVCVMKRHQNAIF